MITVTDNSVQQINAALLSIKNEIEELNKAEKTQADKIKNLENIPTTDVSDIKSELDLAEVAYSGEYSDLKNIPDNLHTYSTQSQQVGVFNNLPVYEKSFTGTANYGARLLIGSITNNSTLPNKVLSIDGALWWKIPTGTAIQNVDYYPITKEFFETEGPAVYIKTPNISSRTYEYFITIRYC